MFTGSSTLSQSLVRLSELRFQNVEKERKCSNCGNQLRKIGNTNVYICDYSILEDNELNGTPVQVFTKCGAVELSD